jgi:hypothetical protein
VRVCASLWTHTSPGAVAAQPLEAFAPVTALLLQQLAARRLCAEDGLQSAAATACRHSPFAEDNNSGGGFGESSFAWGHADMSVARHGGCELQAGADVRACACCCRLPARNSR